MIWEFITNCFYWCVENYKAIVGLLTSANFLTGLAAIVTIIRNIRSTKDNVVASETLTEALNGNNLLHTEVDGVATSLTETKNALTEQASENYKNLTDQLAKTEQDLAESRKENGEIMKSMATMKQEVLELSEIINNKIAAMIEVQSIVYSTIRDENIRTTVNGLLVNAKYAETNSRAKLKREIEELRAKIASQASSMQEMVSKTANVLSNIVDPDDVIKTSENVETEKPVDTTATDVTENTETPKENTNDIVRY